eukprot:gene5635-10855_t
MVHCSAYNCFEDSRKRKSCGSRMAAAENASDISDGPSQPRQKSKTLFKFPSDPPLQKVWITKMGLLNLELKTHSRLCQDHFEEDQFEVGPKFIASLGLEGIKHPSLKPDASPSPKKLSPKKRYRGFAKRRRLEMIAELVKREEATANHDHGKQTSIVLMSDAGIDPAESLEESGKTAVLMETEKVIPLENGNFCVTDEDKVFHIEQMSQQRPESAGHKPGSKKRHGKNNVAKEPIIELIDELDIGHQPPAKFMEHYHNDEPFQIGFIKDYKRAVACKGCENAFPRAFLTIPFDILVIHRERYQYPIKHKEGRVLRIELTKKKMGNQFYCVRKECILKRHPYFWKGRLQTANSVKEHLTQSHI